MKIKVKYLQKDKDNTSKIDKSRAKILYFLKDDTEFLKRMKPTAQQNMIF